MTYKLASYASDPARSRGRLYKNESDIAINEFQRDLNRITHSASFRRLEYKTQVFRNDKGDHYRTRLTHSLEVGQIGRIIASILDLSTDLTEVICVAHDLGHPPFGHAGEKALDKMMKDHGGFDHNANSLKLVTEQEERYFAFNGLNLTWETLEGMVKHNGPLLGKYSRKRPIHHTILEFNKKFGLELNKFASLEAQVAAISDDIAYNTHDLEDGFKAGLFNLKDIQEAGFMNDIIDQVKALSDGAEIQRLIYEVIRRVTNFLILDVTKNSNKRLKEFKIKTFEDVQDANEAIILFSSETLEFVNKLRKFLFENMYRHSSVNRMTYKADKVIKDLFKVYIKNPDCLPRSWLEKNTKDKTDLYLVVCDYIAGMTDRYAMKEHQQLCNF